MIWGRQPVSRLSRIGEMKVRKYLLGAAAAAAIATPAMARDHSGYVGIDAGAMWARSGVHIDATDSYYCDTYSSYISSCSFGIGSKHKLGYDVDAVRRYDFGL